MRKITVALIVTSAAALFASGAMADQVTGLTTFTSGTPAIADSVNSNFSEITDSVNDNDSRITGLEGVRRSLWIPAFGGGDGSTSYMRMIPGFDQMFTRSFTAPSDYVSRGSNDVEYTAVYFGGDDCNFRYGFYSYGYSFGVSADISPMPTTMTAVIPNIDTSSSYYSNPSFTETGFSDINFVSFYRNGSEPEDTCVDGTDEDLNLLGVRVEYPAGQ